MLDTVLASIVDYLRQRTAFPGWAVEFLVCFAVFTSVRFAAAVWNGTILEGETLWVALWASYDSLRAYAEDSVVPALIFTAIVEVIIMVLARKRMRLEREEGREEGRQEGRAEGRQEGLAEVRAELEPIIKDLQERVRRLENGRAEQSPDAPAS